MPLPKCQKQNPLLLTANEYARILKWTDENKEDPEVARKREYVKYLDETSRAMTKSWPNSVENVNKRNEQLRQERIAAAENANNKFYKRYVKRKIEEQERLMYSARDTMFKNQDAPRTMTSALIESYVLKEREEQKKFLKQLKEEAAKRNREYEEGIFRQAEEWHKLQEEKKQRRFEINKEHQKELVEQFNELKEKTKKELDDEIEKQKIDNIMAAKEMAIIAKFEKEYKDKEKQRIFADMKQAKEERDQRLKEQADIDKLDDKLIEVLQRSRASIECQRKKVEAEERAEKLRIRNEITARMQISDTGREQRENEIREKVAREKMEAEDAAIAKRRAKDEKNRQERIKAHQEFLERERQRKHEEETRRQWELMNRFKNDEMVKEYEKQQEAKRLAKIEKFRKDVLEQQAQLADKIRKEKAEEKYMAELAMVKIRDADNKLLTYTQHLIEEARQKEWPTYPIEKARIAEAEAEACNHTDKPSPINHLQSFQREGVDFSENAPWGRSSTYYDHCKRYHLYPETALPKALQEHFPKYKPYDWSKPDADFREPPLPPPDLGPDAYNDDDDDGDKLLTTPPGYTLQRQDGLQDLHMMKSQEKKQETQKKPEESVADYKRAGPANGLQVSPGLDLLVTCMPIRPCTECEKELMPRF